MRIKFNSGLILVNFLSKTGKDGTFFGLKMNFMNEPRLMIKLRKENIRNE